MKPKTAPDETYFGDPVMAPPISGDGTPVFRQRGLDARQQPKPDPYAASIIPIVQGAPHEMIASRQDGNGAAFFGGDGTLYSDRPANDGSTIYADTPITALSGQPVPPRRY